MVRVSWSAELQEQGLRASADEVRGLVESAFKGGSTRVEAHVDPDDATAQRVATFAGLMREGVARGVAASEAVRPTGSSTPGWPTTPRWRTRRASGRC